MAVDSLRQLQLAELNILKQLLVFFENNNISYYALGGTLLGAVRHRGFIPWDDDIDIGIPREDYEMLIKLKDKIPYPLRLCNYQFDNGYMYYFSRVVDDRIKVISTRAKVDEITPAWVDIFPLDGMPENYIIRKIHGFFILEKRALFQLARYERIADQNKKNRSLMEKTIMFSADHLHIHRILSEKRTFQNLDRVLKRVPYELSTYNVNALGAYKLREVFPKNVFGEGRMYQFEDILINGPVDYQKYLTQLYGDWETPADFDHHSVREVVISNE